MAIFAMFFNSKRQKMDIFCLSSDLKSRKQQRPAARRALSRGRAPRSGLAVTGGNRLLRQWCCIRYGNPPISDSHDAYICIFRVIFRLFFNTEEPKQATKCAK